jgi:hypothetical protein
VVSFTPRPLYPPGRSPRYLLYRRLGGPQSRSGQHGEVKILDPTGTRTPTSVVQPVASRYTDCAIPTHPLFGADFKNACGCTSTSPHIFLVSCLIKHRDFVWTTEDCLSPSSCIRRARLWEAPGFYIISSADKAAAA